MRPFRPEKLPRTDLDWEGLIPGIAAAHRALAQFEGALLGVPNPDLLLSPLTTQEAVLSSRIEGTVSTFDEVLRFEAGDRPTEEHKRQDIVEIINYRRALRAAESALARKPFNLNLLLELHGILLEGARGRRKGRGRFRTVQNYIVPPGGRVEDALYIPPEPDLVPAYMENWEAYYHAEERDALVQLAILHAQFEMIHPFVDGNGRIGRMIVPIFLFEKGLLPRPVFYLSAYLEANRHEYYLALRELNGAQSWNRWARFFLEAMAQQARANLEKAKGILQLYDRLKAQVLELTRSPYAIPLLDRIFERPIFAPSMFFDDSGMPSKQTIMGILRRLVKAGVLQQLREARGSRPSILALAELVNLCEGRKVL